MTITITEEDMLDYLSPFLGPGIGEQLYAQMLELDVCERWVVHKDHCEKVRQSCFCSLE